MPFVPPTPLPVRPLRPLRPSPRTRTPVSSALPTPPAPLSAVLSALLALSPLCPVAQPAATAPTASAEHASGSVGTGMGMGVGVSTSMSAAPASRAAIVPVLFNPFAPKLVPPPLPLPLPVPAPAPAPAPVMPVMPAAPQHPVVPEPERKLLEVPTPPSPPSPMQLFDGGAPPPSRRPAGHPPSFVTQAVRTVGTAVVRIDTERVIRASQVPHPLDPLLEDPALAKIFGEPPSRARLERGQGSGFIISADGFLLTNAHVVRKAQKVTVTLTDGRSFVGEVKGADEFLDLAVIKVETEGKKLPVAPMGVSSELEVGDWVIAVGNPVGLDNTVTLGIVSSLNRSSSEVGIPEKRLNLIQTSASLNPGSSGGPICNQWGEVVGISTAVRANAEAIGFAIPIDVAKEVASELARGQAIAHAFVGIKMSNLTPAFARQNNKDPNSTGIVAETDGALVVRVMPKSPAAQAGVRRNDVIVAIDGVKVKSAKDVQAIVDRSRVGQLVNLRVLRGEGGAPIQLEIKTGNLSTVKKEQMVRIPGMEPREQMNTRV